MANPLIVSRRKAAALLAGTFAATSTQVSAASPLRRDAPDTSLASGQSFEDSHRRISLLLERVRRANGAAACADAFEQCKAALRMHHVVETLNAAGTPAVATMALYRHTDPSSVLAIVIVRELERLPVKDAAWLPRFNDLEAAFATHVAEHENTNGYHARRPAKRLRLGHATRRINKDVRGRTYRGGTPSNI